MKQFIPAMLTAAAVAFTPQAVFAQDTDDDAAEASAPVTDERMERLVNQVEAITEIDSLAVINLRQPNEGSDGESEGEDELTSVSEEDLLLGGVGTRQMLTAEDTDDLPPGMAGGDAATADEDMDEHAADADEDEPEVDRSALHDAIENNDVLAGALADRGVDVASVVSVEIRDGATIIVYIDES